MSKIMHMDTQYAGMTPNSFDAILNTFYPVGCYFETSDTSFNPNTAWGGTWVLETEGLVHISAGSNYAVSGAPTDTKDGGEASHVLTPSETATKNHSHTINHGHGFTQPTVNGGSHRHKTFTYAGRTIYKYTNNDTPARWTQEFTNYTDYDGGHTHSVSGGAVSNHSGSSGGQTEANGSAHNNMQPYIVVNRWHRTA